MTAPWNPVKIGQFDDGGATDSYCVQVIGGLAYVADGTDGLEIIEGYAPVSSSPSAPSKSEVEQWIASAKELLQ